MADFDVKKISTNEWIIGGGCIAVFLGQFLTWFKASVSLGGFSGASGTVNGFHYFLQGTLPWLIAIALVVVIGLRKFVPTVNLPDRLGSLAWTQVYLIAAGVIAVLILSRLLMGESGNSVVDVSRGIGLYLASLGAIAIAVGAFLKFQAKEDDAAGAGPGTTPPTPF